MRTMKVYEIYMSPTPEICECCTIHEEFTDLEDNDDSGEKEKEGAYIRFTHGVLVLLPNGDPTKYLKLSHLPREAIIFTAEEFVVKQTLTLI
jgi:hypothetical protein